jgi:DNA-binding NtrC family response regulator
MARILVAEPDPHARRFLTGVLQAAGQEIIEAPDGAGALRVILHTPLDVIVTELRLPGHTGAAIVRAAARLDEHLPCLVLAGFGDLAAIDEALEAGAIGVIPKPTTARQVLCCVARAYERRLLTREAVRGRLLNGMMDAWRAAQPAPVHTTLSGAPLRRVGIG